MSEMFFLSFRLSREVEIILFIGQYLFAGFIGYLELFIQQNQSKEKKIKNTFLKNLG